MPKTHSNGVNIVITRSTEGHNEFEILHFIPSNAEQTLPTRTPRISAVITPHVALFLLNSACSYIVALYSICLKVTAQNAASRPKGTL